MASKKDCEAKEGTPPATDAPSTSEGRQFTGFPRIKLINYGSFHRVRVDFNDMTGVDPELYPDGMNLPKGISLDEWRLAKIYAPAVPTMKAAHERQRIEAAQKEANK